MENSRLLCVEPFRQFPSRRQKIPHDEEDGQPRRRRVDVVGRLSHVDVIVGVDARVRAEPLPEDLGGAIGEHLVGVHVVRRAGAGLIDVDDELIAEPSVQNLVGGPDDRAGKAVRKAAELAVGLSRGFLDEDGGRDERRWRGDAADGKVLDGALRLPAVVGLRRHPDLAERIAFDAVGRGHTKV